MSFDPVLGDIPTYLFNILTRIRVIKAIFSYREKAQVSKYFGQKFVCAKEKIILASTFYSFQLIFVLLPALKTNAIALPLMMRSIY